MLTMAILAMGFKSDPLGCQRLKSSHSSSADDIGVFSTFQIPLWLPLWLPLKIKTILRSELKNCLLTKFRFKLNIFVSLSLCERTQDIKTFLVNIISLLRIDYGNIRGTFKTLVTFLSNIVTHTCR